MTHPDTEWRIYDPRNGDDRVFANRGQQMSTLSEGFWLAEGRSRKWDNSAHLLDAAVAATGDQLYVTFLPWAPDRDRKLAFFRQHLSPVREIDQGLLAATPLNARAVDALGVRTELGGPQSGLWSVGTTTSFDMIVRLWRESGSEGDSPIIGTVAASSAISFAVCMDDGVDLLLLRLREGTEPLADLFRRMLKT